MNRRNIITYQGLAKATKIPPALLMGMSSPDIMFAALALGHERQIWSGVALLQNASSLVASTLSDLIIEILPRRIWLLSWELTELGQSQQWFPPRK
jgi:hypothetical protein